MGSSSVGAERAERRWLALALIVTAQFMVILDVAIVNVALPSIKSDLGFSQASLQWVISAYAIFFGGALLLGGRLGDLLGRRRLFVAGLPLFAASSLLCGLAWSEASLIAFRALQGLGGALLAPAALALLMTTFAEGRDRNRRARHLRRRRRKRRCSRRPARRRADLVSELALDLLHQRSGRPGRDRARPGAAAREPRGVEHRHFDFAGAVSITGGSDAARLRADAGDDGRLGHRARRSACSRASVALVLAFVVIELRSKAPLLPLRIFRLRTLTAANATMLIVGAVAFSEFFILTLYLQDVLHYSAIQSGVAFAGFALTVVVASNVAQVVVGRIGVRATLTAGLLASAVSVAWLTRLPVDGHYFWDLFPAFVLGGAGMGLLVRPRHDREPHGRGACRRGHRVRARQHEPPDRRRDRPRRRQRRSRPLRPGNYADSHSGVTAASGAALDHGFQTALYLLTGLLIAGALVAAGLIRPHRTASEPIELQHPDILKEAA